MLNNNEAERNVVRAKVSTPFAQFVSFCLADQAYAFPINSIQEIVEPQVVSKTPQVPFYIEGLTNLRGSIIPVVRLRSLFGLPAQKPSDEAKMIVVKVASRTIGCTVDSVSQVIRTPLISIQTPPDSWMGAGEQFITGIITSNEQHILILSVEKLLDLKRLSKEYPSSRPMAELAHV